MAFDNIKHCTTKYNNPQARFSESETVMAVLTFVIVLITTDICPCTCTIPGLANTVYNESAPVPYKVSYPVVYCKLL